MDKGDGSMSAQKINRDWRGRRGCKVSTGKCTKGTERRKSGNQERKEERGVGDLARELARQWGGRGDIA